MSELLARDPASGPPPPWWGSVELPVGRLARWRIGTLRTIVRHREREWRIAWWHEAADESDDRAGEAGHRVEEAPDGDLGAPEGATVLRFAASTASDPILRVEPRLADRPIVARPEVPFYVMPGEEASLYLGTPLWMSVSRPRGGVLVEVATRRLSDSWFGPSTIRGELCYSTKIKARLDPTNLTDGPDMARTEVRLVNRAADPLLLERIALPAPHLKLYVDRGSGLFWTQPITVERRTDGESAKVTMGRRPAELADCEKVAEPRRREPTNVLDRALSALLR